MAIKYLVLFTTPTGESYWHEYESRHELFIGEKVSLDDGYGACEVINTRKDTDGQMLAFCVLWPKEQFMPQRPGR